MERIHSKEIIESTKASMIESVESRASSLIFSDTFSDERIEDMSDEALQTLCDRLRLSTNLTRIENLLFEQFASRVDPAILVYVNQSLSQYTTHHHGSPTTQSNACIVGRRSSIDSVTSARTSISKQQHTSSNATRNYPERMPKLSLQQKMDIVAKELEILTTSMEEDKQKWKRSQACILAATEEASLRLNMAQEALTKLENGFSHEWLDPITGRVPAEKFIRFLKEQIRTAEGTLDRCSLKTSTLQGHYHHAKRQLHYKEDLGEALCPIDFEQLKIDNAQLKETLRKKNQYLLDLKQISGKCVPTMAEKKKNLWKQTKELKTLKKRIASGEASQVQMEHDAEVVESEIGAALAKRHSLRKLISGYHAPDVMDYIKKKAELDELQRWKHLWSHRRNILNIAMNK